MTWQTSTRLRVVSRWPWPFVTAGVLGRINRSFICDCKPASSFRRGGASGVTVFRLEFEPNVTFYEEKLVTRVCLSLAGSRGEDTHNMCAKMTLIDGQTRGMAQTSRDGQINRNNFEHIQYISFLFPFVHRTKITLSLNATTKLYHFWQLICHQMLL